MTTTVRNIKDGTYDPTNPSHIYIGRSVFLHRFEPVRRGSKWANPTALRNSASLRERGALIERYRDVYLPSRPDLVAALPELKGKTLFCWCRPSACHGDILAELADKEPA
ncbi:MAG TPA: DUF4326 domain-containing protein [Chloroflexota bacterium]|nr:DUF4326 domain-containing protein [Chloroflexota bacterium]